MLELSTYAGKHATINIIQFEAKPSSLPYGSIQKK